jgi:methyltransferase (TIGR00027 family)
MQPRSPSLTACGAATHRAAHQTLEKGAIFADPFACAILGEDPATIAQSEAAKPERRPMRLFMAARSRFAEDSLEAAYARGTRQAVILGAGFDTFSLRNPHCDLRVFEVDHPATQAWKRQRIADANLNVPPTLTFVPLDFEAQSLANELAAQGFNAARPAFFIWLGVVPYLTREAITATLGFVASVPHGEVVFDYSEPLENYPHDARLRAEALAMRVAKAGEPFLSHFNPNDMAAILRGCGFGELEDLGAADVAQRFFGMKADDVKGRAGPHLMRARRD